MTPGSEVCQLSIDGKVIKARVGTTVLEAARSAGVYVPTLCQHSYLSPSGTCRLCVVEVEGVRGLPCSCTLSVAEGMVVHTETSIVQEFRRAILEVILREHPSDCLVCVENTRCEVQRVTSYVGLDRSRLNEGSADHKVKDDGIYFNRDYRLCVRCGRCVRVCHEIRGDNAIYFVPDQRGFAIGTPLDRSLKESGCTFCGACVDVCPTGALADKAQVMLPERVVATICPHCGVGCQLQVEAKGGRILQTVPDPNGPVNHGQGCVKGRFRVAEVVHRADRLTHPLVRRNGALVEATWDEALSLVAENLAKYSGQQVGMVSSAGATNEDNCVAQKFARVALRTNNVDHDTRPCHAADKLGLAESFGSGAMTNSIREVGDSACILVIGADVTETHPVVGLEVKRAVRRGGKLIVVNLDKVELADLASVWLKNTPGSDEAVLKAIMRVIADEGLQDRGFIQERSEGFETFRASLEGYTLDFAEKASGVSRGLIVRAARMFATNRPACIVYAPSAPQDSHGANALDLANLAMLTGNVGRPSSGVYPLLDHSNQQGACDMGALPDFLPGYQRIADESVRSKFEAEWNCSLSFGRGLTAAEMVEAAIQGQVRAIYLMGGDSALSGLDAQRAKALADKVEFLVVQDMVLSEAAKRADVVLPACSFAEKDGTFTNTERRVQRVRKVIGEVGQSKPDWWILCQVAQRMGARGFEYAGPSQIMEEIAQLTPDYAGISYPRLEAGGLQWPCPSDGHPGTPVLHSSGFIIGKGKFASRPAYSADASSTFAA